MRTLALLAVVASLLIGCDSKKASEQSGSAAPPPRAPLVDVTSLAPVRTAFNAHAGEVRFLTLLSPT